MILKDLRQQWFQSGIKTPKVIFPTQGIDMARPIGPFMANKKFYKNVGAGKQVILVKKRSVKALTKGQKKQVKQIVARSSETKYHAEQLLTKQTLDWAIHTAWTPSSVGDTMPLVPRIVQGDGNYQRVGSKVRPTKCRVDIELSLPESPTGLPLQNQYTNDIFVVMYILRPKTSKNFQQFSNILTPASGSYTDELLDNGDGTSKGFGNGIIIGGTPYVYSNMADLQLPVNREYFTQVRRKVVRLVKNAGNTYGDGSNYPNVTKGGSSWRGSFVYKLPTLKFDDDSKTISLNGGYPTNANMVLCVGAALANGCDSIAYTSGEPSSILPNPVQVNVRTHYWYKDA